MSSTTPYIQGYTQPQPHPQDQRQAPQFQQQSFDFNQSYEVGVHYREDIDRERDRQRPQRQHVEQGYQGGPPQQQQPPQGYHRTQTFPVNQHPNQAPLPDPVQQGYPQSSPRINQSNQLPNQPPNYQPNHQQNQPPSQPPSHQPSHQPSHSNALSSFASRLRRLSISSNSSTSPSNTPVGSNSPANMEISKFSSPPPATHSGDLDFRSATPIDRAQSPLPDLPKDTPPEMLPVLTLLTAQQNREYFKGYFMLLNDLTSNGKTVQDRKWTEVFGKLTGTVLSIWDANSLNGTLDGKDPTPTYINISDSTFKSIPSLPSPNGDLENIIVLSTTMKNRYLLQFSTVKMFQDWTAALRLSVFEYCSLQEAYTGALLSAKGSKLNGIRTLLSETKFRHEEWCRVRFGSGMPWKKCWTVITPIEMKKKKKLSRPGTISFYEDQKQSLKGHPLAVATAGYAAYAIYPEKSVLVNGSTLIKIEGKVIFSDSDGEKDTGIFIMPEQHPGVVGYETLIRFLIPVLDVFKLYGRPQRLNADKSDMRSLLFGMPTLPKCQYLDVVDLSLLVAVNGSDKWNGPDWTKNIKEILARKISTGYRGTGSINEVLNSPVNSETSSLQSRRDRAVSNPNPPDMRLVNGSETPPLRQATPQFTSSPLANPPRSGRDRSDSNSSGFGAAQPGSMTMPVVPTATSVITPGPGLAAVTGPAPIPGSFPTTTRGPNIQPSRNAPPPPNTLGIPKSHERSASEGQDPNNLMSTVGPTTQPLSPLVDEFNNFRPPQNRPTYQRNPNSSDSSFVLQDEDNRSNSRAGIREELFGSREPVDSINSIGQRNINPGFEGAPKSPPSSKGSVHRRPISSEYKKPPPQNMFDPTANTSAPNLTSPPEVSNRPSPPYNQGPPRTQSPGIRATGQYPPPPNQQQQYPPQRPGPSRSYSPGPGRPQQQQRQPSNPQQQQVPPQRYQQAPPQQYQQQQAPPQQYQQQQAPPQQYQQQAPPQQYQQQAPPQQRQQQRQPPVDAYGRGVPPPSMFGNAPQQPQQPPQF